ncbi:MAG: nucleotide-binding universal stress UspA family protein [Cyclobacteriaceae bacterium]|jgi:nucleotide-binding universal stress UspA family protein
MKFKNILVPIDFSDCSKNALRVAIDLAKKFDSKIYLVNAVHLHSLNGDIIGGRMLETIMAEYEAQVKQSFEVLEQEVIELSDVPHKADRFLSYLIDAIYSECVAKNIDLVVMGTRAEHDKIEHLLGSRATDIVDSAQVPVLVIPENWEKSGFERIGFAFEAEEIKNLNRIRMLNNLANAYKANVLGFTIKNNTEDVTVKEQKIFSEIVSNFDEGVASVRTIAADSIIHGIQEFILNQNLDMLSIIPKKHNFFERIFKSSITKNIVLESQIPILSFRE